MKRHIKTVGQLMLRYAIIFLVLLVSIQAFISIKQLRHNSADIKVIVKAQTNTIKLNEISLNQQSKIITNLAQAVVDLKQDNLNQTDYIECLLNRPQHICVRTQESALPVITQGDK